MAPLTASIIIPAWGSPDLTAACLREIHAHTTENVQIIVVDNTGGDHHIPGYGTFLFNKTNRGFAATCNQGAQLANGDVFVFLNNDTEVFDGWLAAIIRAFTIYFEVGIVGARLLYPNGLIQHAGITVNLEAAMAQNVQVDKPSRVVQAVTGACLAIRREAFEDIGGFDEGYWNGYEDVDLCLQLRKRFGWLTWYERAAIVMHRESASGPERWTHVGQNIERARVRWN